MSSIAVSTRRPRTDARVRRHAQAHDGSEPWRRRDAFVLAVCATLGVIGLVIGWVGVSGTVDLDRQVGWLGFGIGALILGGLGMLWWLLSGLREITLLRREVIAELNRHQPASLRDATIPDARLGTVAGMRRYHAAGCAMLAGKNPEFAPAVVHREAGLRPCGICLPEQHRPAEHRPAEPRPGEQRPADRAAGGDGP